MNPKRVLIGGLTGNTGGLEIYIMNIYRNLDKTRLQFDFLNYSSGPLSFNDEILEMGGHIFNVPGRMKHPIKHYLTINSIMRDNDYSGFYYQCNRKLKTIELFKYAKKYGIKKRVMHSHNISDMKRSILTIFREKITELSYDKYATDYFACSEEAGKWMFSNREFTVINNSIDTNIFRFDENTRNRLRNEFNVNDDTVVLGTVGRLAYQKNPEFIVEVFKEYHLKNPNSIFIHVGDGDERTNIENKITNYGLADCYHILGTKNNVADYMNAMDVFLFPSRYEGFGIVLIEAQSVGLHIIADESVPRSSKVSNLITYKRSDNPKEWSEEIEIILNESEPRTDMSNIVSESGFGIDNLANKMQVYFSE